MCWRGGREREGSGSEGKRECAAAARSCVTFSASGDFRFNARAARQQSRVSDRITGGCGRDDHICHRGSDYLGRARGGEPNLDSAAVRSSRPLCPPVCHPSSVFAPLRVGSTLRANKGGLNNSAIIASSKRLRNDSFLIFFLYLALLG